MGINPSSGCFGVWGRPIRNTSPSNSRGEFVGDAVELSTGENHAYLATPSQSGTETELAAPNTQSLKLVLPENVRRMLRQRLGRRFGTSQLSVK
jgi:hypothetical protein